MRVIIMTEKVEFLENLRYIRLAAEKYGSAASCCCYKELNTDI